MGGKVTMNYKNGFFQLLHKEDGTYIKVFPAMNGGKELQIDEIIKYLQYKKILEFDLCELNQILAKAKAPIEYRVTEESIFPENELLKITVSMDRTKVLGRFYPPSSKGKLIDKNEILSDLEHKGIKYGISEKNIDAYLKGRQFCTNVLLAQAMLPRHGTDAVIKYHFNLDVTAKPTINEDGSVDFHQLDNISGVKEGDLLATLQPADMGTPGIDVYGGAIKPKKVIVKHLKHGRNIHLSEDGTKMYADVSGHVSLADEKVFVSNTYEVPADVGPATGDIKYDGNIVIKGNVITGYKVEATGDIVVYGVVEGATLIAEGQIILKRGIQGRDKGILRANSGIVTKFIESSEVYSDGMVTTDAILHSTVIAKGDIVVTGKRGLVTGGTIKSETMISLKTAGSTMGTRTNLVVGIDPALADEFKKLEKNTIEMNLELEKVEQIINIYKKKLMSGEKLKEDKLRHLKECTQKSAMLHAELKKTEERVEEIREEAEKKDSGKIRVQNIIYPGCKLEINNVIYYVRGEMHFCQFIKDKADVKAVTL